MLETRYPSSHTIQVGCDEAGRGCLAGPVVAAAVWWPEEIRHEMIRDSKKLSAIQREKMAEFIQTHAKAYAVAEVSHEEIDQINILKASILAMHKAIELLKIHIDLLLIDGNRFYPYKDIPYHCIVKGDSKYISIAAASILAKTRRDQIMKDYHRDFPEYHFNQNKGYSSPAHIHAIEKMGYSTIHRKTFKLKKFAGQLFLFE